MTYSYTSQPDDQNNVYVIESNVEIGPRIVRETIDWYKSEPHHRALDNPESGKKVFIAVSEVSGGTCHSWRHI